MAYGNHGGRPPTPTGLKILQGTFRKDRANPDEPQPPDLDVAAPPGLTGAAKNKWTALVSQLSALGVLKQTDRDALEAYCMLWVRWKKLERESKRNPLLVGDMVKVFVQVKGLMAELGLSPSSRSRIHVTPPKKPESKLAKFTDGKASA